MKTTFNCSKNLDQEHSVLWKETRTLIQRKYEHLKSHHPDLDLAELHLSAKNHQSEVHLIVHDSKHRLLEAHAKDRLLHKAIRICFRRAERQLGKPKHLQQKAVLAEPTVVS